jgi:hypothetical protein
MGKRKLKMMSEIMQNFDFERVQTTMHALNWTWRGSKQSPTLSELQETAENLLISAIDGIQKEWYIKPDVSYFACTGGFEAMAILGEDLKLSYLSLKFILSEWDVNKK